MRADRALVYLLFSLSLAGCGGTTSLVCEPACPAEFHCTQSGCVANSASAVDMAASAGDLGDRCNGLCGGATPRCNASGQCVPCLVDGDCPLGDICQITPNLTACVPGCTDSSRCGGDGGAGESCCSGQCTDTNSDVYNCGACAKSCSGGNAQQTCAGGACMLGTCNPGWGDCDKNSQNGCEANFHIDIANCGGCGTVCAFPNAIAACSDSCYLAACDFGFDDCNASVMDGCETSVLTDPKNCGACGSVCASPPHATAACVNAGCQVVSCMPGYLDCDDNAQNGCEVEVATDSNNCGACGNVCPQNQICVNGGCTCQNCSIPNAVSQCVNGQCLFKSCLPGFADCNGNAQDGCEVNLNSDKANCTGCGIACPMGQACVNGACANCNGNVLLIGDDQGAANTTLANAVSAAGLSPTLVANGSITYSGVPNAANFGAVVILIGNNYATDLPAAGQQSIATAVAGGTGVVLTEWFAYQLSTGHYQSLSGLELFTRTSGVTSQLTYTSQVSHPIWTGLPMSFTTTNTMGGNTGMILANGGVQIAGCAQCMGTGVAVRDNGGGRVVQASFAADYTSGNAGGAAAWSNDPNLTLMMINSIKWAARCM